MAADAASSSTTIRPKKGHKEPSNNSFTQQELPACRPLLTPAWVVGIFLAVGVIFLPIGAACLATALSVRELSVRYDEQCIAGSSDAQRDAALLQTNGSGTLCKVALAVAANMKAPVYVYYELDNFYQSHRRYVRSRDDSQLRGEDRIGANLDGCEPQRYLAGNTSAIIDPCGLVAWSLFNDSFAMQVNGTALPVSSAGIAWRTDREDKFSATVQPANFNTVPALRGGGTLPQAPLRSDERFVVWMRTAAVPNFRKLWGVIDQDLAAESVITISIVNAYNTYRFGGSKKLVLSTASWLGGRNTFMGVAYIVVGATSVLFSLLFFVVQSVIPRTQGDASRLSFAKAGSLQPR